MSYSCNTIKTVICLIIHFLSYQIQLWLLVGVVRSINIIYYIFWSHQSFVVLNTQQSNICAPRIILVWQLLDWANGMLMDVCSWLQVPAHTTLICPASNSTPVTLPFVKLSIFLFFYQPTNWFRCHLDHLVVSYKLQHPDHCQLTRTWARAL